MDKGSTYLGEASVSYKSNEALKTKFEGKKVKHYKDVESYLREIWDNDLEISETIYAVLLNRANNIIGHTLLGKGGISGVICNGHKMFQSAIKANAGAVILAHNHPSGTLEFSKADLKLTTNYSTACSLLGIRLLDHLVLTSTGSISMLESADRDALKAKSSSYIPDQSEVVAYDKNNEAIREGDLVKHYVTRLSSSPWWRISSEYDGKSYEYYLFKKVVKTENRQGMKSFGLVDTDETEGQRRNLKKVKGSERVYRILDEINWVAHKDLELV